VSLTVRQFLFTWTKQDNSHSNVARFARSRRFIATLRAHWDFYHVPFLSIRTKMSGITSNFPIWARFWLTLNWPNLPQISLVFLDSNDPKQRVDPLKRFIMSPGSLHALTRPLTPTQSSLWPDLWPQTKVIECHSNLTQFPWSQISPEALGPPQASYNIARVFAPQMPPPTSTQSVLCHEWMSFQSGSNCKVSMDNSTSSHKDMMQRLTQVELGAHKCALMYVSSQITCLRNCVECWTILCKKSPPSLEVEVQCTAKSPHGRLKGLTSLFRARPA
jgi:hypothetical protein